MVVRVEDLAEAELGAFIARSNAEYIRERVEAGDSLDYARQRAREANEQYFPGGAPAPGHRVLAVIDDDGAAVGWLWLGPFSAEHPADWWVFDIEIEAERRGRGLGRAAMLLAEEVAREGGATRLGLNVFGHNTVAQHLYSTLGYGVTAINMSKPL
ncbi:GNAT family N-acetyltransferase [Herbiconiux moechotypicola]|nr:GNAT family N-acetyltransferase [Herbiconiux moechotypicola]MCS5731655.1 GNAT family N-acetyltransferase [Herbiconiux moechotypicola]